jgi:Holliday junction resolvase-like predicted endonuclease
MNFLERLVADWYGHHGYLVQTNLRFGKRAKGGYEGEIDVLGVNLKERALVHVETSGDADSWRERREKILRKFKNAEKHYVAASGATFDSITRMAVVGVRPSRKPITLDGIEIVSIDELMGRIKDYVRKLNPASEAIPEVHGYLRAVQFAVWYGTDNDKAQLS